MPGLHYSDIWHGRPKSYQPTMYNRERTIFRALAAGEQDVLLDPISVRPGLFMQGDIQTEENKDNWMGFMNTFVADYYNLKSVLLRSTRWPHRINWTFFEIFQHHHRGFEDAGSWREPKIGVRIR